MTLQKLLNLKIIEDNAFIKVINKNPDKEYHINRVFRRPITKEDCIKSGMTEEMLSYKVKSIFGSEWKYKVGIWLEA
jgi:hypothetical protein